MPGRRTLAGAVAVSAVGLGAAVYGLDRYDDAYTWVAHTSDVRLVIGRAVGHAGRNPSCDGLQRDLADLTSLLRGNRQRHELPALGASVELVCAGQTAPDLIDQLADLDATQRALLVERRVRLADLRTWTLIAFVMSTLGATVTVTLAIVYQRRAARAMADSEERFRLMAATSRDLIRIHDATGRPTYVSPSVKDALGYTPEEMLGEQPLALGHPEDLEQMRQALADVQQLHAAGSTLVYRLKHKDGGYRWFETHTNPIRDVRGRLIRFYTSARDITERIELGKRLEVVAVTDELTGLLNRRGFLLVAAKQHLNAVRKKLGVAVIFADLDGLKVINDQLGHEHGDRAIRGLGEILRSTFRESDVIARLGGDEFVVHAYDIDQAGLTSVLARLDAVVAAAPPIGSYRIAASLGVAVQAPGGDRSLDALLADADQAMYDSKRRRKAAGAEP